MAPQDTPDSYANLPVWVVDDDDVRYSIRFALATHNLNASAFSSGEAFFNAVDPAEPGCLVVDMSMPGMSGMEAISKLKALDSPIRVILLSGHGTIRIAVEAMEKGAVSFLEKPIDPDELVKKVRTALALSFLEHGKTRIRRLLGRLSKREAQIFELLCQGYKNNEIADKLFLSQRTIEVHRAHILRHLEGEAPIRLLYDLARVSLEKSPLAVPPRQRKPRKAASASTGE